jgi:6-phosphofructokinase 1
MGRNAGWLTASSALAAYKGLGPDLVYMPEIPFDLDKFLGEVENIYASTGNVIAAVSEGLKDKDGMYVPEIAKKSLARDSFDHAQLGGTASILASIISAKTKAKVRPIEFSLLQRCAAHWASKTDVDEAFYVGRTAVRLALEGKSGYMVGLERAPGAEYACNTILLDVSDVANKEKKIPDEWINGAGDGLLQPFIDYASPLIRGESAIAIEDGLPRFARLKKVRPA